MSALTDLEMRYLIENMQVFNIEDILTKQWIQWHSNLLKLSQLAILEVNGNCEECIKECLVSCNKIMVLIQETISIQVWKETILKNFLEKPDENINTFLIYAILYHESTCMTLLEIVLYHPDSFETIQNVITDFCDYVYENILKLLSFKSDKNDNNEVVRLNNSIEFHISVKSLTIMRYLIQNLNRLSNSLTLRLLRTYDLPLLFVELIQIRFWVQNDQLYSDGKWEKLEKNSESNLCKIEAQIWIVFHQLLLNENVIRNYEINDYRKGQLLKLQKYLNETLIDQLPILNELRYWLCQLSISNVQSNLSNNANLILEEVPQMKSILLNFVNRNFREIFEKHYNIIANKDQKFLRNYAICLSSCYDTGMTQNELPTNRCNLCAKLTNKKCSKCKNVFYCCRKCQINDWESHKKLCL